ncbi:hypothetical protein D8674_026061 [Pyrus ussuriensis x Pyrus communis]|uniref:Uncharacterized protein n=1 Tax=Pyrus ussuriensis x Pyrus communis TaxID=2448454 RepID=A0A5N5I8J5_9ROSA|nr:hypothetical protein D8674_026061 [Pyrus ussuriensis x Pyrus communis]
MNEASSLNGLNLPNNLSTNDDEEWTLVIGKNVLKLQPQVAHIWSVGQERSFHCHAKKTCLKANARMTKLERREGLKAWKPQARVVLEDYFPKGFFKHSSTMVACYMVLLLTLDSLAPS